MTKQLFNNKNYNKNYNNLIIYLNFFEKNNSILLDESEKLNFSFNDSYNIFNDKLKKKKFHRFKKIVIFSKSKKITPIATQLEEVKTNIFENEDLNDNISNDVNNTITDTNVVKNIFKKKESNKTKKKNYFLEKKKLFFKKFKIKKLNFKKFNFNKKKVFFNYFFSKKKMHKFAELKNVELFKKNSFILGLKRRYGLLKFKYNEKLFFFKKFNYLNKFSKKKLLPTTLYKEKDFFSLRKKNLGKHFFKYVRKSLYPYYYNNYKWVRQKKSNKLFFELKKNKNYFFNLSVYDCLLNYSFFLSLYDLNNFNQKIGILFNFNYLTNLKQTFNVNDVISIPQNEFYFFYKKKLYKNIKYFLKQIKSKLFKYYSNKARPKAPYIFFKKGLPNWILKFKNYQQSLYKNIEICFLTLTIVYIYNVPKINYLYENDFDKMSLYMSDQYNWKYIV